MCSETNRIFEPVCSETNKTSQGSIAKAVFINFFSHFFSMLIMANGLTVLNSRLLCYSGPVGSWDPCAQKPIGSSDPCAQKPIRPPWGSIAEAVSINFFDRFFSMFIMANGLTILKSRLVCYSGPIGSRDPCAQKPIGSWDPCAQKPIRSPRGSIAEKVFINFFSPFFLCLSWLTR